MHPDSHVREASKQLNGLPNIFLPGAGIIYLCHRVFLSKVPRAVRPEVLSIKIRGDINKLCQTKGWKIFPIHAESQTAWQNQNAQILTLWEVSLGRWWKWHFRKRNAKWFKKIESTKSKATKRKANYWVEKVNEESKTLSGEEHHGYECQDFKRRANQLHQEHPGVFQEDGVWYRWHPRTVHEPFGSQGKRETHAECWLPRRIRCTADETKMSTVFETTLGHAQTFSEKCLGVCWLEPHLAWPAPAPPPTRPLMPLVPSSSSTAVLR